MKIHFNSYIPSWSTMLDILPNSIHSSAGTLICKSWMGGRSSIKISPLVLIGSFFLGLGVLLITFLDTHRKKKKVLQKCFVQKHHVSDENHVQESMCNQTGYFKMSVSILFQRQWGGPLCTDTIPWKYCTYSTHTGTYVTSIYLQRIFVEQNYSYKFTWFIINNKKN